MTEPGASDMRVQTPAERAVARIEEEAHEPVATEVARTAAAGDIHAGTVTTEVEPDPQQGSSVTAPIDPPMSASTGARPAATVEPTGEVEVECPGCGLILVGDTPRPTASWFCPECDYPVFWASPPPPSSPPQKRARRRLPGTRGATVLGAAPCWNCGELNEPDSTGCVRCGATLPRPTVPEPAPRIVTVAAPVPVPYAQPAAVWPFVVAGTLAGAAFATSVTLWVLRLAGVLGGG